MFVGFYVAFGLLYLKNVLFFQFGFFDKKPLINQNCFEKEKELVNRTAAKY